MDRVNIHITSTAKGPAAQESVGMFIIEVVRGKELVTEEGFLYREKITGCELELQLFVNALHKARSIHDEYDTIECYIENERICTAFSDRWIDSWQSNEWKTAKGKEVANADTWKLLCDYIEKSTKKVIVKSAEKSSFRNWMRLQCKNSLETKQKIRFYENKIYGGESNGND